jgi:hypothetical protein
MHAAATVIQCLARIRQARQRVMRERKRRALGPEVVEMLRKGSRISGHTMTVVIYRCGGSYKVVGQDMVHGSQYMGFVYEPEMTKLLEWHNAQYEVSIAQVILSSSGSVIGYVFCALGPAICCRDGQSRDALAAPTSGRGVAA